MKYKEHMKENKKLSATQNILNIFFWGSQIVSFTILIIQQIRIIINSLCEKIYIM